MRDRSDAPDVCMTARNHGIARTPRIRPLPTPVSVLNFFLRRLPATVRARQDQERQRGFVPAAHTLTGADEDPGGGWGVSGRLIAVFDLRYLTSFMDVVYMDEMLMGAWHTRVTRDVGAPSARRLRIAAHHHLADFPHGNGRRRSSSKSQNLQTCRAQCEYVCFAVCRTLMTPRRCRRLRSTGSTDT